MRVLDHPILGKAKLGRKVTFYFNGEPVEGYEGEPIAAALIAAGIKVLRITPKLGEPRGVFCAIGRCSDCIVLANGMPVRACVTPVEEGLDVRSFSGGGRS